MTHMRRMGLLLKESERTCPFRSGTAPCPADLHARLPVRSTQTGNAQAGPFRSVSIDVLDGRDVVKGGLGAVEIDDGFTGRKPGRRRSNRGVPEIEVNENLADRIGLGYEGYDFHAAATLGTDERGHLVNASNKLRPFSSVRSGRKPGLFDRCDGGLWRALSQDLAVASSPVSVRVEPVHSGIVFALIRDVNAELCDKVQGQKSPLLRALAAGPVEDLVLVLPVGEVFERDRTLNEISDHPLYCLVLPILYVTKEDLTGLEPVELPVEEEGMEPYLADDLFVQSAHPEIVEQARRIAGGETNALRVAELLLRWVHDTLEKRAVPSLPNALEVLHTKVGDCNEHTVLYVALARALGLPARTNVGLVMVDDRFYYHAWPEVYVGEWIAVDPVFHQIPADATHIRLIRGGLDKQVEIARKGVTVFMSTHSLEVAEETCHRIAVIMHGRILVKGTLEELAREAGSEQGRLESIFLELTGGSVTEVGEFLRDISIG